MRRVTAIVVSVACFSLAALLALVAADVVEWRAALASGDVRYRVAPEDDGLWGASTSLPLPAARTLLAVDDDVAFRRALRSLRLARLEAQDASDPELELLRNDARARLEAVAAEDRDPRIRSRATALLGVLSFSSALAETEDQTALLDAAVASFRSAIALDPANGEAKLNLELGLQRSRGLRATSAGGGPNPRPGGAGSKGAGAGERGSGY